MSVHYDVILRSGSFDALTLGTRNLKTLDLTRFSIKVLTLPP